VSDTVIIVENLTKRYDSTVGVDQISFDVMKGEVFGFLGPNGAGKTTTIRLLLDLIRPSGGSIHVFGKRAAGNTTEIRSRCGYLQGDFVGYGQMTGREFLRYASEMRRVMPVMQDDLLHRFKLVPDDLAKKMKHLSHGTRQKLGIVQAFFHDPELIILDEPTSGLDPLMQEAFYDLVREVRDTGKTVFLSSHNLPEVEKICERIAIVREGKLVALETLEDLKHKRFRRMILTLREPVPEMQLTSVELMRRQGLQFEFLVKGGMQLLLEELVRLPVADVVFPEPDLEEVFMACYEAESNE
jgi:ABC-2 type transport system ATP-binding protein